MPAATAGALVVDGALPAALLDAAGREVAELEALQEAEGGACGALEDEGASLSSGSFWWPAGQAPRLACEAVCAALLECHGVEGARGAEWWFQAVAPEDAPKECHTDCDITLDAASGECVRRHPAVSNVVYLTEAGETPGRQARREDPGEGLVHGPTVVFGQAKRWAGPRGTSTLEPARAADIADAAVCFPRRGRVLAFPGDRLHRVCRLGRGAAAPAGDRLTLLANIWVGSPPGGASPEPPGLPPAAPPSQLQALLQGCRQRWHAGGREALVCRTPAAFTQDAAEWARGELPPQVQEAAVVGGSAFVAVEYQPAAAALAPGSTADAECGGAGADDGEPWWERFACY